MTEQKNIECRMYKHELPSIGDLVMCKCYEVGDLGSYVYLLEYEGFSGMITTSELSRKRIRSLSQVINVGKVFVAEVINVDTERKYIDLSKKNVTSENRHTHEEKYHLAKKIQTLVKYIAREETSKENASKQTMLDVYEKYIWSKYKDYNEASIDFIKKSTTDSDDVLTEACKRFFKLEKQHIVGLVSLICLGYEGIDAVKNVLKLIKEKYNNAFNINYYPLNQGDTSMYGFHTHTTDYENVCNMINQAMNDAIFEIRKYGGGDGTIKQIAKINDGKTESCILPDTDDSD